MFTSMVINFSNLLRISLSSSILVLCLIVISSPALAQDIANPPDSREAMWPAPTAEDWKKPCLIKWQRSYEDALIVSRETGKPILVCVNMDGEIASEHYAGIRYRDPEIAKLYEPYVCVIASVYRHSPRDYDDQGRRILCPRFGSVTCGEHIGIEPGLFKKFFEGQRVAPRHVAVELDGEEMYDVFYAFDTDSVFKAIEEGVKDRASNDQPIVRGDRSIIERVASRDIDDRKAVEKAYIEGDRTMKQSLLEAALDLGKAAPVDLLRLPVFGFDLELSQLARRVLAKSESKGVVNLIDEALRVPMKSDERTDLIAALKRLGESTPRARMLAVVHEGLAGRSDVIDVESWSKALDQAGQAVDQVDRSVIEARLNNQDKIFESSDVVAHLNLADAFLTVAFEQPEAQKDYARCLLTDAHQTALNCEKLGSTDWRTSAVIGLSAYYLGNLDEAFARAESAVSRMPPGEIGWKSVAVLGMLAEARWKAIANAVRDKRDWDAWSAAFEGAGHWLTDVHAAYSVLARHPLGTDSHVMAHYDFLKVLGATGQASQVLDEGMSRFPDSWGLHNRFRRRILREKGLEGLETVYEEMILKKTDSQKNLQWFAGYTSIVVAEFHRRAGNEEKALAAYGRAIAHYESEMKANPESRDSCDHYIAVAFGGRARIAYEKKDNEGALKEIVASFNRKPDAAATLDGLNISTVDTAKMLLSRFKSQKLDDMAKKLEDAMSELDPEMLRLPAYEGEGPRRSMRGSGGRRPRRGQ